MPGAGRGISKPASELVSREEKPTSEELHEQKDTDPAIHRPPANRVLQPLKQHCRVADAASVYREVLRDAIHALTKHQLSHAQETQAMPRERALGEFVRQQLRPLSARDDVTRYIHILNWEAVRPTAV